MKPGVFILFIFDVLQFSQTEIRHRQQDKYATKQNYTTIPWSSSTTTYLNKKNNNNLQKENYYLTTNVSKNDWTVTMPHVVSSKNGDDYDFRSITSQSSSRSVKKTTTNHFSYVDTTDDDNKIVVNDDDDDDDDVDNDDVIKYYDSNDNRTNYDDDDDRDFIGVKHETTREYSIATFKKINDEKITGKFVDDSPEEKFIFYNESHLESSTQSHVSTNDGIFHRVKENVAVMKNKNRRSDDDDNNNTTSPSFVGNNNKNFYFAQPLVALAESVDGIVDDDDNNNNNNNNIDDDCFENIVENFSITDDIVSENILTDRNEAEKLTNVLARNKGDLDKMTDVMDSIMAEHDRISSISVVKLKKTDGSRISQTVYRKGSEILISRRSDRTFLLPVNNNNNNSWTKIFKNCLTKFWTFGYYFFIENDTVR
ncbi:conserved hypothetical protein [Pediculus humanus corporis]|uniref:Uncharacterized protein n=1 Tax=Pediculus humanus subsp. corporis TaxID=121224 RepID=E0VR89_PEDHC|nr:uncharacterized protein Phum_PHUM394730 [Pediculus humanus corporis]EEB15895.1 conserved hypothetical protein [Pediculus humanus corporis]